MSIPTRLISAADGQVRSPEGWVLRPLSPEILEYDDGRAACLINVGAPSRNFVRPIYASESASDLFPRLREHLREAVPLLKGSYVVI